MAIYIISAIDKTDEHGYAEYESEAYASFEGHPGIEILAVSDDVRQVEGTPPARRMVIIRAEDQATFDRWYHSPAYQSAKAKRLAASNTWFTAMLE